MSESVTVQIEEGDGRIVIHLPVALDLLTLLVDGIGVRWPRARTLRTGREDVLVIDLEPKDRL